MSTKISRFFSLLLGFLILMPLFLKSQEVKSVATENVIAQMNYCITALTNIVNTKSIAVLEQESDNLINNLTMEQLIGLHEIKDFRIDLLEAISKFEITEQERIQIKRLQSVKRDNIRWQALSNALRPTNLIMGKQMKLQLIYQTMLTAARSTVEFGQVTGELEHEELYAMWELRKEDLKTINDIRKQALAITFDLYNKYHLDESARFTEATAELFSRYITEVDPKKRIRLLEDNYGTYKYMSAYYYHLGMAYLDVNEYDNAKVYFNQYMVLYSKAPILRHDAKSGCIALAVLSHEKDLSKEQNEELIDIAIKNLPSNSAAILQCAMRYLDMGEEEKGLDLLRSNLDDPMASDKSITALACANLLSIATKYPTIYNVIEAYFEKGTFIDLESYMIFLINSRKNAWNNLLELLFFENVSYKPWYFFWKSNSSLKKRFTLKLPKNIVTDLNDLLVYREDYEANKLSITQLQVSYSNAITLKEVEKVDCFKENRDLKFLFLNTIKPGEIFILKEGIDINKIESEQYPRMSEFVLNSGDIKDIVKFCNKYKHRTQVAQLTLSSMKGKGISMSLLDNKPDIEFIGDSLHYIPYYSFDKNATYTRFLLKGGLNVVFKYNNMDNCLEPYLYSHDDRIIFFSKDVEQEFSAVLEDDNSQEEEKANKKGSFFSSFKEMCRKFIKKIKSSSKK